MARSMTLSVHVGDGDLDAGDLGRGRLVADGVHQVGGSQHVLAGHVDLDARLGDPVLDESLRARLVRKVLRSRERIT